MARVVICSNCGEEFTYSKRGRLPRRPLCNKCSAAARAAEHPIRSKKRSKKFKKNSYAPQNETKGNIPDKDSEALKINLAKNEDPENDETTQEPLVVLYKPIPPTEEEKPFSPGEKLFHPSSTFPNHTPPWRFGSELIFVEYGDNGTKIVKVKRKVNGKVVYEILPTKLPLYRYKKVRVKESEVET